MLQTNWKIAPSSRRIPRGRPQAKYLAFPVRIKWGGKGKAQWPQSHENAVEGLWMNIRPTGGKSKLLPVGVTMTLRDPQQPSLVCAASLM